MSMIGNFRAIAAEDIDALSERPQRIGRFLYGEDWEDPSPGLLARLRGRGHADEWRPSPGEPDELDVDKAWHGIHFLLTGTAWEGSPPLDFVAAGGREVGDLDVGYGPARLLAPEQVTALAHAMEPLGVDELSERFDAARMAELEIYPEIWDEGDEARDYVLWYYDTLKTFIGRTAERRQGLLISLN